MKMQIAAAMIAASAASCATVQPSNPNAAAVNQLDLTVTVHRDGDDLLTAGLGIAGLSNPVAPAFADPAKPTAAELRRRAILGLVLVWHRPYPAPGSGYGVTYGTTAAVPGREYSAMAKIPGATTGHRGAGADLDAFDQQTLSAGGTVLGLARVLLCHQRCRAVGFAQGLPRCTPTKARAAITLMSAKNFGPSAGNGGPRRPGLDPQDR